MKHPEDFIIGISDDGQSTKVNIETLMRTRGFIAASSGGGKSHTLRLIAERLSPVVQVIVLDPEGEYSTLREKYPFVLVGPGGETPAHPHTAAQVALTLLKLGTSAVCDIYELKGNGRHEFVRNFIAAMVDAPKELWHPVVVIVDEAHTFCPEAGYGESVAKDAIIDLCNLGRKRGFCPILATQRASKISKNAYEPLQNFFIGLTMPVDQKRVCDIFKVAPGAQTREFSRQLETLDRGLFFVRGAAVSKTQVLVHVDKTETKPPPTGSAAAARITPTPESIKHLLPTLSDIPVEAERKAKTEADLRKEVLELQKQIRELSRNGITPERENMLLQQLEVATKTAKGYEAAMGRIFEKSGVVIDAMNAVRTEIERIRESQSAADFMVQATKTAQSFPVAELRNVPSSISGKNLVAKDFSEPSGVKLRSGAERMLAALAQWFPNGRTESQVAAQVQMKRTGGTWAAYKSDLKTQGYLELRDGLWFATEAGVHYFGGDVPAMPTTTREVLALWSPKLRSGAVNMLQALIDRKGESITREQLGEAVGMESKGGTFSAYLSDLRTAHLIVTGGGIVAANKETLFL